VLVGEVLWTSILMLAGYYATEAIIRRANWGMLALVVVLLVIFLFMLFLVIPRALRRNQQLSELAIDDEPR
jgi:membrane protein DedA with SNARE-associated domain